MAEPWKKNDNLKGPCRLCGGVLVVRQSGKDGGLFVGCRSFPSCRFNRAIKAADELDDAPWPPEDTPALPAGIHPEVAPLVDELPAEPEHRCVADALGLGHVDDEDHDPFEDLGPVGGEEDVDPDTEAIEEAAAEAGIPREDYDEPEDADERKYTGSRCVECHTPQFMSPSGVTCEGGHGGASGYVATDLDEVVRGQHTLGRSIADSFEKDCGHVFRLSIAIEPIEDGVEADTVEGFEIPIDLERVKFRRGAVPHVALEIVGYLLPQITDAVRRAML